MIYLDNAATTKLSDAAWEAMKPYLQEEYGNAMSSYALGRSADYAMERAREKIARAINASPKEIYFTAGGSESNNWVIKSFLPEILNGEKKKIITSRIEHPSVENALRYLEKFGFQVVRVPVDPEGRVQLEVLKNLLDEKTILVTLMTANNEIGSIQPVDEAGEICREQGILFHTDAVQAAGHLPIDVKKIKADYLSASAHKFGGPKGSGFLYVRKGLLPEPLIHGGGQERKLRAGTHNVPGIVGMGAAFAESCNKMEERRKKETKMRDYFIGRVLEEIPGSRVNGGIAHRLPGNCSFCFPGISNEAMLFYLDQKGIAASAGSACAAGAAEPSRVLKAVGLSDREAMESVRFTLSYRNTEEEIDRTVAVIREFADRHKERSRR